ncbi:AI-2E family transporter [Salinicoccus halodurans]|uniref:Lipoprotein n=1 Tax=Salinicoccus halodurans TaxID=407035 RepID=A0A0F7HIN6_9STAP|nr:AI-2E family transporter [Salinicoccus halodurans]AKG72912.1 lipoprotein [Salinicoccus halodurans]SFK76030.1 Predicted PurR-regulated permease PerM [Salinicoccus halodurans]
MMNKNWFQTGIAIVITLLVIALMLQIQMVFEPFYIILTTVFFPLLLGGLLYYITEPIQRMLERFRAGRLFSTGVVFFIVLIVIAGLGAIIVPMIVTETQHLMARAPHLQREFEELFEFLMTQRERLPFDVQNQLDKIMEQANEIIQGLSSGIITVLANIIEVLVAVILVPFFLFFMLKDHEKFIPAAISPFSGTLKQFLNELLNDIDYTLKAFIQGQVLVSIILAVILYTGYAIIGLDYAILLALFALFMNVIPFIGPWIAFAPALILALIQDPIMGVWVALITLIAQQIDGNIITPNVMGQKLHLHPLTIITVVLAAGNIAGFVGMLIAIPFYAVIKAAIQNIWRYRRNISKTMFSES